jgi:hypothetical protein
MTQPPQLQIEALFMQAEQAHGEYERSVLNGVYDQNWADWYAQYAIDQGIKTLLGAPLSTEQLSQLLSQSYEQYKAEQVKSQHWATYTAQKLVKRFINK